MPCSRRVSAFGSSNKIGPTPSPNMCYYAVLGAGSRELFPSHTFTSFFDRNLSCSVTGPNTDGVPSSTQLQAGKVGSSPLKYCLKQYRDAVKTQNEEYSIPPEPLKQVGSIRSTKNCHILARNCAKEARETATEKSPLFLQYLLASAGAEGERFCWGIDVFSERAR